MRRGCRIDGCPEQGEPGTDLCARHRAILARRTTDGRRGLGVVAAPPVETTRAVIPSATERELAAAVPVQRLAAEARIAVLVPATPARPAAKRPAPQPEPVPEVVVQAPAPIQPSPPKPQPLCRIAGCAAAVCWRGLCRAHEAQENRARAAREAGRRFVPRSPFSAPHPIQEIPVPKCNAKVTPPCPEESATGSGLCGKHYAQKWRDEQGGGTWKPRPLRDAPSPQGDKPTSARARAAASKKPAPKPAAKPAPVLAAITAPTSAPAGFAADLPPVSHLPTDYLLDCVREAKRRRDQLTAGLAELADSEAA